MFSYYSWRNQRIGEDEELISLYNQLQDKVLNNRGSIKDVQTTLEITRFYNNPKKAAKILLKRLYPEYGSFSSFFTNQQLFYNSRKRDNVEHDIGFLECELDVNCMSKQYTYTSKKKLLNDELYDYDAGCYYEIARRQHEDSRNDLITK